VRRLVHFPTKGLLIPVSVVPKCHSPGSYGSVQETGGDGLSRGFAIQRRDKAKDAKEGAAKTHNMKERKETQTSPEKGGGL